MNNRLYDDWIESRFKADAPDRFTETVMRETIRIHDQRAEARNTGLRARSRLAVMDALGAAALLAGSFLGVIRASAMAMKLLFP